MAEAIFINLFMIIISMVVVFCLKRKLNDYRIIMMSECFIWLFAALISWRLTDAAFYPFYGTLYLLWAVLSLPANWKNHQLPTLAIRQ